MKFACSMGFWQLQIKWYDCHLCDVTTPIAHRFAVKQHLHCTYTVVAYKLGQSIMGQKMHFCIVCINFAV